VLAVLRRRAPGTACSHAPRTACARIFANVRSDDERSSTVSRERGIDRRLDLGDTEGVPRDLRQRLGVDQELVAKHGLELAHVHLGHEDMSEALQ